MRVHHEEATQDEFLAARGLRRGLAGLGVEAMYLLGVCVLHLERVLGVLHLVPVDAAILLLGAVLGALAIFDAIHAHKNGASRRQLALATSAGVLAVVVPVWAIAQAVVFVLSH